MVKLGAAVSNVIIDEFGSDELLRRLCDRNWFQALACVIGYDWHSSGTTTVTIGALKEGLKDNPDIFIAGGKGKAGIRTLQDIVHGTDLLSIGSDSGSFTEYSRLAAKVDANLVYDRIGIYHHSFIFTKNRKWGVVQQAMDPATKNAIRFQWFSDYIDSSDLTNEPHASVCSEIKKSTLDLTYSDNKWAKNASVELVNDQHALESALKGQKPLQASLPDPSSYPQRHCIIRSDITERGWDAIKKAGELEPDDYKRLMLVKGMGRSTLRSLAFISSLVYDKELAYRDPVMYSYNLGGKDGTPFRINKNTYDCVITEMEHIVDSSNIEKKEKYDALKRLSASLSSKQ
jgi:hypothetical protein